MLIFQQTRESGILVFAVFVQKIHFEFRGAGGVGFGFAAGKDSDFQSRPLRQFQPVPVAHMEKLDFIAVVTVADAAVCKHTVHIQDNGCDFIAFFRPVHESPLPRQ